MSATAAKKSYFPLPRTVEEPIGRRVFPHERGEQPLERRTEKFFFPPRSRNPPPRYPMERYPHVYSCTCAPLSRKVWPFLPGSIRKGVGEQTTVNPVRWTHWIQDRKICIYGGWIEEKIRKFRRRFSWFWIILHPHSLLGPWIDGTLQRDGKGPWIRYYYYMLEIPVYRRGTKDFVKLDGRMAARIWITAWRERKLCRGCLIFIDIRLEIFQYFQDSCIFIIFYINNHFW